MQRLKSLPGVRAVLMVAVLACLGATTWKMFQFHGRLAAIENPQWEETLSGEGVYGRHPIVLFGDSQIFNWPIATSFGALPVLDRGFVGDFATEANARFEREVLPLKPSLVVILIGTNDLAHGKTTEAILGSIEQMTWSARRQNAAVILCSLFPARGGAARIRPRQAIEQINSGLQVLAHKHEAAFVDLFSELIDGRGELPATFSDDGLHLNRAGYLRVTKVLLPRLLPYLGIEPGVRPTASD